MSNKLKRTDIQLIVKDVYEWNYTWGNEWKFDAIAEEKFFNEELDEFEKACKIWDKKEALDWLCDMVVIFIWTLYKSWNSEENTINILMNIFNAEDAASVKWYYPSKIRNAFDKISFFIWDFYLAFCRISNSNWSKFEKKPDWSFKIVKNNDWKIMKPVTYFKPDLSDCILSTDEIKNEN